MKELLLLIIEFFRKLFAKASLPHPEEGINENASIENIAPNDFIYSVNKWINDWKVPSLFHPFWLSVNITLVPNLTILYNGQLTHVPAATYAQERRMEIDPQWANPGVIGHEMCHIAQIFLPGMEPFMVAYNTSTDPLLKLVKDKMQGKDPAWANSPLEIHADCYRYLGERMPKSLKRFYPYLF